MEMYGFALIAGHGDEMVFTETLEAAYHSARELRSDLVSISPTANLPPSPVYRIRLKPFTPEVVVMMLNEPAMEIEQIVEKMEVVGYVSEDLSSLPTTH